MKHVVHFRPWFRCGALTLSLLLISSCVTRVGPFVSNVFPVGPKRMNIEKCFWKWDRFTGQMAMGDCSVQTIELP